MGEGVSYGRGRLEGETAGVVVLPGEGGAKQGEGFAGAGGGLEEGVAVALPPGPVQGRDHPPHVRQLGTVWLVRELHGHARYLVHAFGARARVRVRVLEERRRIHFHFFSSPSLLRFGGEVDE